MHAARGTRMPMPIPVRPNVRYLLDYGSKTFGASRNFLFFAVNCDCSRENLCLAANTSISQRKGGAGVDGTDPDLRQA